MLIISCFSSITNAQPVSSFPYFCGFEDALESSSWVLNAGSLGSLSASKWYIGNATANMGNNSLYISSDGGLTPSYNGSSQTAVVAFREVTLPASGNYTLSFSWRSQGNTNAKLHVCWLPVNIVTESSFMGLPSWVTTHGLIAPLNGSSSWQHTSITIPSTGATYKLVFVWENTNGTAQNPGACIDNIQIGRTSGCSVPTSLTHTKSGTSVTISWIGSASNYEMQYNKSNESSKIYKESNITNNTVSITQLNEGVYTFWVRSICSDGTKSIWIPIRNIVVYDPNAHCLDYLNFEAPGVLCETGTYSNIHVSQGAVDLGYNSPQSQHTVHFMPDETDPRTNNLLKTIPDGEVASVRIGSWVDNYSANKSSTITYTLDITPDIGIVLLRYAVIQEGAEYHTPNVDQPYFKLDILSENGSPIDPGKIACNSSNFSVPSVVQYGVDGWHQGIEEDDFVSWREWQTVGLNVQQYVGQKIKIRLSTVGCADAIHFGYAYFTLNCASATITSNTCGSTEKISVTAPDGFDYEWYKFDANGTKNIVGTNSKDFEVGTNESGTYYVDVIYKENSQCRFTLSAVLQPRFPLAKAGYFYNPSNCENKVYLSNTSAVLGEDGLETGESVESYKWTISDGRSFEEKTPVITFPDAGGTYQVSLKVGIADDRCTDSTSFTMVIPPIRVSNDTVRQTICQGSKFTFNGIVRDKTGFYTANLKSRAGCDSIVVLNLNVVQKITAEVYDTICAGERYTNPNGGSFSKPGIYMYTTSSSLGCDSVTTLHLEVLNKTTFAATAHDALSGPNSGSIDLSIASNYSYSINDTINGNLKNLPVGTYKIIVFNEQNCASDPQFFQINTICLSLDTLPIGVICGDDPSFSVPFIISEGYLSGYSVKFGEKALFEGFEDISTSALNNTNSDVVINLPDSVRPDIYDANLIFHDLNCIDNENNTFDIKFTVFYPSEIVQQKWNDVLAVLNEKFNGGYTFSSFQWYKNGLPIPGETGSYLYLSKGEIFNTSDVYYIMLTRIGENYSIQSCPIYPVLRDEQTISIYPTLLNKGEYITINNVSNKKLDIRVRNSMGILQSLHSSMESQFKQKMPEVSGVYIVEISSAETLERNIYSVIVK